MHDRKANKRLTFTERFGWPRQSGPHSHKSRQWQFDWPWLSTAETMYNVGYRLGRGHGRTVANFSLGKTFFAHIFAKNGSIYVKGRMKWSPVQSTHIVEYFSPAEMLRFACVCLSSSVCTECIVAKRCILKQKLLLTAYRKSYMRNQSVPRSMTLTFVYRSYQGHVNHCVTFDVEFLGNRYRQRLSSKGPSIGNGIWGINWSRDRRRHMTPKGEVRQYSRLS